MKRPLKPRMRGVAGGAALAVSSLLILTGCGASSSGSTKLDVTAPVTLTWWTGQTDAAEKVVEKLAAEFEKTHPNVTIDVSSGAPTTDDLLQKLSAGFASDRYPDISYAYGSWAGELAASGRTLDITDKVADPAVKWDELPASGRATATPTGKTIGFPSIVDNLSLIYNPAIFDAAGVAHPTNDWTWDDFRDAAHKLTDAKTGTYGFAYPVDGGEDTTWHLWPLLWQKGGSILTESGDRSAFDSSAGVSALGFLRDMAVDDRSVYLDQTGQKYGPLFVSGRIAMIISGPWQLYDTVKAKTPYGVTFLPAFDGEHTTVSGPDIWALFDHRDANRAHWSYEFTKWLTDPEQDARFNLALGNLPLRESERSLPEFAEFEKAYPGVGVMVDNFANVTVARPTVAGYSGVSAAVGRAIASTLQGATTPKKALADAATAADRALAAK